jgi:type IV secretory pathway VirB2 component (pilin)
MSAFLTNIGTFFTQTFTWLTDIVEIVTGNPALTVLVIAMPIVGFAIGVFNRLIRG